MLGWIVAFGSCCVQRHLRRCAALGVSLAMGVGCADYDADHDSKIPGDPLGSYTVKGAIKLDSCDADLLGAPDPWTFPLKLSRFEQDLYWLNGREAIVGTIDASGKAFAFDTRIALELGKEPNANSPATCQVTRRDRASGSLTFNGDELASFAGSLSFHYEARVGSDCPQILGVPGGVATLPCDLGYDIVGTRAGSN